MYENYEERDDFPYEKEVGITPGFFVGLIGAVLAVITLFVPFAIARKMDESIVDITKLYLSTTAEDWGEASRANFYKIFMCVIIVLVIFVAIMYIRANIKGRPGKMIFWSMAMVIVYQILKYDFADRRVVPGSCDKGIAFTLIWVVYGLMFVGAIIRKLGNK